MNDVAEASEEGLVVAAQAGDPRAFDALTVRYRSAAVVLARQYLPADAAEDAAQDALISAFRALGNLSDPGRFKAWLGAIVRNRARRLARDREDAVPVHELDGSELTVSQPEPADDELHRAVEGLPEGIRETTRLYYWESWSVGEISAFTGRPVTTVKWQLHAGRELLRRRLGHREDRGEEK
jgi:RNA polymerase sigma-70 factor (ECF subfamily)